MKQFTLVPILALGRCWSLRPVAAPGRTLPLPPYSPNILLITIDTLRADRSARGLTPAIDGLRRAACVSTDARTTAPLTLPSHVRS